MDNNIYLLFDGNCSLCQKAVKRLKVLDFFNNVIYVNALDRDLLKKYRLDYIKEEDLLYDMHVIVKEKIYRGFDAYRKAFQYVPLLWIMVPFLYLKPVERWGRNKYRKVADSRSCTLE